MTLARMMRSVALVSLGLRGRPSHRSVGELFRIVGRFQDNAFRRGALTETLLWGRVHNAMLARATELGDPGLTIEMVHDLGLEFGLRPPPPTTCQEFFFSKRMDSTAQ